MPLIVGEAPSRTTDPARPLTGSCGRQLADLAGLDEDLFRRVFARANLLDAWPGRSAKGATFPRRVDVRVVDALRRRFRSGRLVVPLGKRVARAVGYDVDYFARFRESNGATVVVVPHPSGVNRWYNDAANVRQMRRFMRGAWRDGIRSRR